MRSKALERSRAHTLTVDKTVNNITDAINSMRATSAFFYVRSSEVIREFYLKQPTQKV